MGTPPHRPSSVRGGESSPVSGIWFKKQSVISILAVNGDFRVQNWWFSVFWDKHLIVNGIWGKISQLTGQRTPLPPLRWITEIQGKSVVFYYYLYQVMFLNYCRTVLKHLFRFFRNLETQILKKLVSVNTITLFMREFQSLKCDISYFLY